MERSDPKIRIPRIYTEKQNPKDVCNNSGHDNDNKDNNVFLKVTQSNKRRRPPLERGISRNNSDTNLLPVANVILVDLLTQMKYFSISV